MSNAAKLMLSNAADNGLQLP